MILVTVGTDESLSGFLRLIKEMDIIAAKTSEKIVMQIGLSKYIPQNAEYFKFAPREDYEKLCQEARIIICHDGAGSIMTAFQFKKPVVVVPRTPKSAERERDENDLATELEKRQVIKAVWDTRNLESAISSISRNGLSPLNSERGNLVHKLREHISNIEKKKATKNKKGRRMETRKETWQAYYKRLAAQYRDAHSLPYKKVRLVDSHIDTGKTLLDIGSGTGELLELEKHKFENIYGIDRVKESIDICNKRFYKEQNITLIKDSIGKLECYFQPRHFDCITCLDVLEHLNLKKCKEALSTMLNLLCNNGRFIFTAPGFLSKIIEKKLDGTPHLHSHSSYGWKKMIKQARFTITSVETVEFPIIHSEFLRKKLHLFGKCCLIVAHKLPSKEQQEQ